MSKTSAVFAADADRELLLLLEQIQQAQELIRAGRYAAALGELETMPATVLRAVDDVALAYRLNGATWQQVGDKLNLTRQAAFARYSQRLK